MSATAEVTMQARLHFSASRLLQGAEEFTNRFAPAGVCVFVLVFAIWAWFASRGTRLQFDELLEISAASAPSNHQVLSYLASGVDFNPPLSHFVVRGSMRLFGDTELAARLPAFLGVIILLMCLYAFVARMFSRSYSIVAILTILCLPVRDYAIQARPYGLMLGFSGLTLIVYQSITERRRRALALIGLSVCTAAVVASHYYAILFIGVLLTAELARAWEMKRLDWALLACTAGPPFTILVLLHDVMRQQHHQLTHYFSRGNLLSFDHGYDVLAMDPMVYCVALLLIIGVIGYRRGVAFVSVTTRPGPEPRLNEIVLPLGLLLLPIIGAVVSQFVTHAYVPRYFLPAAIGLAICICYIARLFSRVVPGVVVLLMVPLALGFGKAVLQEVSHPVEKLPSIAVLAAEQTPLLFDTPSNYAQIYHYYPALRSNMWVIVDPAASLRYRQYDTDDKIMLALAEHESAQTISLSGAVRRWPHFRLVPRSADYIWALKCVMNAGSHIEVKHPFGDSNFIFDVSVSPEKYAQIDVCAEPAR